MLLAATILGSSVAFIDSSVVSVALPAMAQGLGVPSADLTWVVTAYFLPLGALTLLGGGVGDRFGRRRFFLAGLAVFALASAVCALAPNLAVLLAGRALQGLGAAILMPNSLAILGAGFEGAERGRAIGVWAAAGALFGVAGPVAGGWIVDVAGWRWIFAINLPVIAAAAVLAWRFVPESRDAGAARLDWGGAALATAGLFLVTYALAEAAVPDPAGARIALATGLGIAALGLFVRLEARLGERALMPVAIFGARSVVGLNLLTFFLYGALGGFAVLLPFVLVAEAGYSALAAGSAILPLPALIGLGSPLAGRLAARTGPRPFLLGGSLLVAAGILLVLLMADGRFDYATRVLPSVLLVAVGMTLCVAPLTTAVMEAVEPGRIGAASGVNSAVARIGTLFATAALGFVLPAATTGAGTLDRLPLAAFAGAAIAALAAAAALLVEASPAPGRPGRGTDAGR